MRRISMIPVLLSFLGVPAVADETQPVVLRREAYLMGTLCSIQGMAGEREQGLAAMEAGFAAIEATEALLSTWRNETPLARLGGARAGEAVKVPPELARLLARVRELGTESGGAFDPAIGALVRAWNLRGEGRVPAAAELADAMTRSGMSRVVVDAGNAAVTLAVDGLSFDAGGFGKGAGLARAGAALTRMGLRNWLIDFGGQVLTDPQGPPREIAVAHPRDRQRPVATLSLRGLSAATSSLAERPGHILDPRSGRPAKDFGSVTVIGADPLQVDALATGFFVLGPVQGLAQAENLAGIEALYLLLDGDGRLSARATTGFKDYLVDLQAPWADPASPSAQISRSGSSGGHPETSRPQDEGTVISEAPGGAAGAGDVPLPERGSAKRLTELEQRVRELEAELAAAADRQETDPGALHELERRMDIISREIEELRIGEAAVTADQAAHGLGPAAAKIYHAGKGVSIGGYGEMLLQRYADSKDDGSPAGMSDSFDLLRAVIYLGYKFNDRILFNSEIEFEHASTEENGAVSVEFAYLDFLFREEINARAGMVLVPMGFINELHEPPIFLGARRPDLERQLIPATWSENGAGVFGDVGPVSYRAYVLTGFDGAGLDGEGFSAGGLRGGRQGGSESVAEDFAFVARADWEITPGLTLGGSYYIGDSGQGAESAGETINARTEITDVHLQWRWRGLDFRALYVTVDLEEADLLNDFKGLTGSDSIGSQMGGYYLQAGYDVLAFNQSGQALIPYARYEQFDTQKEVPDGFLRDPANDVGVVTYGIAYKPIPKVIVKLDYQNFDNAAGTGVNQWNLAAGFLF